VSLQFLFSIRNCKTVVVVCSDHIVVDRLCVCEEKLGVLVLSLWQELVQKYICVLGPPYLVSYILTVLLILLTLYSN